MSALGESEAPTNRAIPHECEPRHSGAIEYWGTLLLRHAALPAAPARERSMRTSAILLAALGIVSLCLASGPSARAQQKPAQEPTPAPAGKAPIDKFSV